MSSILNENLVIVSVPIIGVFNKVINSNLEIVSQVEFFTFSPEVLARDETMDAIDSIGFIFDFANARARLKTSLSTKLSDQEFYEELQPEMMSWAGDYKEFFMSIFQNGYVKEFKVMNPGSEISTSKKPPLP